MAVHIQIFDVEERLARGYWAKMATDLKFLFKLIKQYIYIYIYFVSRQQANAAAAGMRQMREPNKYVRLLKKYANI